MEDEMVRWHHQLNGHELERTPGDSEVQGKLTHCSLWGRRVRHNLETEQQQHVPFFVSCYSLCFEFILSDVSITTPVFFYLHLNEISFVIPSLSVSVLIFEVNLL